MSAPERPEVPGQRCTCGDPLAVSLVAPHTGRFVHDGGGERDGELACHYADAPTPPPTPDYPALVDAVRALTTLPDPADDWAAHDREAANRAHFMAGVLADPVLTPRDVRAVTAALRDRAARTLPYTPAGETPAGGAS